MPLSSSPSENPVPHNPTLWAILNPWFRNYSSLAGALGEQKPGQEAPTLRSIPPSSSGVSEWHQEHVHTPVPFGRFGVSPGQHTPKLTAQDVRNVPPLEPGTNGRASQDGHGWGGIDGTGGSNDEDCNHWTVTDLLGEKPIFCRVGTCRYWHMDPRQVKRHRDTHFERRYSFLCPNRATCPSRGGSFRRRDGVGVHCKRSPQCGDALRANGGTIWLKGTPATEEDLQPYDPTFHIPYERFDGRTGRGGGKVAKM